MRTQLSLTQLKEIPNNSCSGKMNRLEVMHTLLNCVFLPIAGISEQGPPTASLFL